MSVRPQVCCQDSPSIDSCRTVIKVGSTSSGTQRRPIGPVRKQQVLHSRAFSMIEVGEERKGEVHVESQGGLSADHSKLVKGRVPMFPLTNANLQQSYSQPGDKQQAHRHPKDKQPGNKLRGHAPSPKPSRAQTARPQEPQDKH